MGRKNIKDIYKQETSKYWNLDKLKYIKWLESKMQTFRMMEKEIDELQFENKQLREALEHLVHLHNCEMEGIEDSMPTFKMWFDAVIQAEKALKQIKE